MNSVLQFYADPGVIVSAEEFFGIETATIPTDDTPARGQTPKTSWVPSTMLATATLAVGVLWVPFTDPNLVVASSGTVNVSVATAGADASVKLPRLTEAQTRGAKLISHRFVKRSPDDAGNDPEYGF